MRHTIGPSTYHQRAEERLCTCGASGSGEGHADWCPWELSEWKKWGDAFDKVSRASETSGASKAAEAMREAAKVCSICSAKTNLACSNCRMDLNTTVYVCHAPKCRDAHEENCPYYLQADLRAENENAFLQGAMAMRVACAEVVEWKGYPHCGTLSHLIRVCPIPARAALSTKETFL